jgi:acyl-coenzyme A synthetase/AMP-(fatty) acid ligase
VGRDDLVVKTRGYRVGLGEIEQLLLQNEHVQQAVVLALPDEEIGSRLVAVVVLQGPAENVRDTLEQFCLSVLPKYMVPEEFLIRENVPRTTTGKVDREALAKQLSDYESG